MPALQLESKRHTKRPEGWEIKKTITNPETGKEVAAVIHWPWSDISVEQAEEILANRLYLAGYDWADVDQNEGY